MSRKKRIYDDDDGRTIVDMSGVSAPNMFSVRSVPEKKAPQAPEREKQDRPWEDTGYTGKERLMIVLGTLKATLLIAGVFIGGIGIFVLLLYLLA